MLGDIYIVFEGISLSFKYLDLNRIFMIVVNPLEKFVHYRFITVLICFLYFLTRLKFKMKTEEICNEITVYL